MEILDFSVAKDTRQAPLAIEFLGKQERESTIIRMLWASLNNVERIKVSYDEERRLSFRISIEIIKSLWNLDRCQKSTEVRLVIREEQRDRRRRRIRNFTHAREESRIPRVMHA